MLDRLRRATSRLRRLEQRVQDLEGAVAAQDASEEPSELDQLVHDAVELNASVLVRRIDALHASLDVLRAELEAGMDHRRRHTEEAIEVAERKLVRRIDIVRRAVESRPAAGSGPIQAGGPSRAEGPPIDDALYVALEDRFRGETAMIEERQRSYLPHLGGMVDQEHPLLDIGSGRGEWLRILAEAQVPARGIDTNPVLVAECRERGLDVVDADLTDHLAGLPEGSLGAVTMFQVVEHLPFPVLVEAVRSVARVLRPGGVFIAETPNALNLRVAATNFWIDPTHQRPLHPEVLVFLALECGFAAVERLFLNPIGDASTDLSGLPAGAAATLGRLVDQVDGPGDFCLVARTPSER